MVSQNYRVPPYLIPRLRQLGAEIPNLYVPQPIAVTSISNYIINFSRLLPPTPKCVDSTCMWKMGSQYRPLLIGASAILDRGRLSLIHPQRYGYDPSHILEYIWGRIVFLTICHVSKGFLVERSQFGTITSPSWIIFYQRLKRKHCIPSLLYILKVHSISRNLKACSPIRTNPGLRIRQPTRWITGYAFWISSNGHV